MSEASVTRLREEIATCTRLLVMQGVMDFSGHVSARIPDTDRILIQPQDTSRAALTANDILVVDLDRNVLEGKQRAPAETVLHTEIYKARPDAAAICHGHPNISIIFSVVDRPLLAVRNFAYRFMDGVPVHSDTTHIRTIEQGRALAKTLGNHQVCLMRAHGMAVVSPSIQQLFMDCLDFEENARTLLCAATLGTLLPLTQKENEENRASYGRLDYRAGKVWEHYLYKGKLAGVL